MDFQALASELNIDPLGRGYAGMTDGEAADDLNTKYRTSQLDRLEHTDISDSIDITEWGALSDTDQSKMSELLRIGGSALNVGANSFARNRIINLFGGGSTTVSNLVALATVSISRGAELGFGRVSWQDVNKARSL
jgi:hypothetical protein